MANLAPSGATPSGGLAPLHAPRGEGYALRQDITGLSGTAVAYDIEDDDPALKRCRSMKRPKGLAPDALYDGCKGFRVTDSDYCQGHKTMIDKETAAREAAE